MLRSLVVLLIVKTILCDDCNLPKRLIDEIASYGPAVKKIANTAVNGDFKKVTYDELVTFIDKFGSRLTGTQNLENSIDYMLNRSVTYGLEDVHGEELDVPYWLRGEERATLLEPLHTNMSILGIGPSVGTPPEGITAEAIVVKSFDELRERGAKLISGKIVIFNQKFDNYLQSAQYRDEGPSEAAKLGAVAALVRSVTPFSLYTLHAGWEFTDYNGKKIPAASITVEDAHMLQRMQDRGSRLRIFLKMIENEVETKKSRNVVASINGSVNREQFVLVSGHLDSWDVGKGAVDDGGGVFVSWGAVALLKKLNLRAKRTIRAVLWTAEEQGLLGAIAYDKAHDLKNFNFVIESDLGTFKPFGIEYNTNSDGGCILREVAKLLAPINTTQVKYEKEGVGSDIYIWQEKNISAASLLNQNDKIFWYHHTEADTMDVEEPDNLDKATAIFASVAYVIADLSIDFPKISDPKGKAFRRIKEHHC